MSMITINLRYFALLREERGLTEERITTDSATAGDLYATLATAHSFSLPAARVRVAINDNFTAMQTPLQDGDTVVFVPPVAGG